MSLVAPNQLLSSHSGVVLCTAFSPDGTQLVSGSSDTTLKIWNAATGKEHRTFMGHSCPVITACWSRDGQLIASGDDGTASAPAGRGAAAVGDDDAASFRGAIIIWDVSSGRALKCLQLPERRNFSGAYSCSFSPASSELVVGCDDHLVVFCCSSWRVIHVMSGVHSGPVLSLAYSSSSPQGPPLIAAGDWAGNLSVWSSSSGRCLRVARAHTQRVRCVAFSPDDVFLASASDDCSVRLWRVATLQLVVILNGHFDWVRFVAFTPNGAGLITASDDTTVRVWRTGPQGWGGSPAVVRRQILNTDSWARSWSGYGARSAALSLDGTRIVMGVCDSPFLRVWPVTWSTATHPLACKRFRVLAKVFLLCFYRRCPGGFGCNARQAFVEEVLRIVADACGGCEFLGESSRHIA